MTRSPARTPLLAAAAVLSLGALAGCGDAGGTSASAAGSVSPAPSTPATSPSATSSSPAAPQSSPSAPASSKQPAATAALITVKDFDYHGARTVKPGQTVKVKNEDSTTHTLTADGAGGFDVTISPGDTATFTAPDKTGKFPYHCNFHSNMHGTLVVR